MEALFTGVDYLIFVDSDVQPSVLHRTPDGEVGFDEVDFFGAHLYGMSLGATITSSDYSGYNILPPASFEGMADLLWGLHKEDMAESWQSSEVCGGLIVQEAETPELQPTTKVLGGNMGIRMSALTTLPPFFSPYYFYNKTPLLARGAAMYLVNPVLFDAEWQNIYRKHEVRDGTFNAIDGTKRTVSMMYSNESLYLDDGKATGFLKPYKNGYSFAALLPNEGVALDDYIASLTGEGFLTTVKNAKEGPVEAAMPKFSYDYGIEMSDALKALGMTVPFDAELADFSGLGHSSDGSIYISCVLHKAYIAVDEKGTKAGAATAIEAPAAGNWEDRRRVILDRPFVYAIIDDAAGLPIFIGAVTDIQK